MKIKVAVVLGVAALYLTLSCRDDVEPKQVQSSLEGPDAGSDAATDGVSDGGPQVDWSRLTQKCEQPDDCPDASCVTFGHGIGKYCVARGVLACGDIIIACPSSEQTCVLAESYPPYAYCV